MRCLPIWGTMRMLEHSDKPNFWIKFFEKLYLSGVRYLHSSYEYESFSLLSQSLKLLEKKKKIVFSHVVKLAEPSFHEKKFSKNRFNAKLDFYKLLLPGKIKIIQWMWRSNQIEKKRIKLFINNQKKINTTIGKLDVFCFPYTKKFANLSLDLLSIKGLMFYWNSSETEFYEISKKVSKKKRKNIIIRPFINSKEKIITKKSLNYCKKIPKLKGIIFTATKKKHLEESLDFFFNRS